ncbi:MAG: plastocyanin/azurin family copper-binding protein [Gelidibacter sp.]
MKKLFLTPILVAALFLGACSDDDNKDEPVVVEPISFNLEGNDQMKFNLNEFQILAKQEVTLTLKHSGNMDKNVMGHNIVILTPQTDLNAFGQASAESAATGYIPKSFESSIISSSKMLGGGESDTINFNIDTPGVYNFVCSFPGHYAIMKGTITVK